MDGSVLRQTEAVPVVDVGKDQVSTDGMVFRFTTVPLQELAGVVVSENGRLYVREIKATQ
jgi:hypothetical protein